MSLDAFRSRVSDGARGQDKDPNGGRPKKKKDPTDRKLLCPAFLWIRGAPAHHLLGRCAERTQTTQIMACVARVFLTSTFFVLSQPGVAAEGMRLCTSKAASRFS